MLIISELTSIKEEEGEGEEGEAAAATLGPSTRE